MSNLTIPLVTISVITIPPLNAIYERLTTKFDNKSLSAIVGPKWNCFLWFCPLDMKLPLSKKIRRKKCGRTFHFAYLKEILQYAQFIFKVKILANQNYRIYFFFFLEGGVTRVWISYRNLYLLLSLNYRVHSTHSFVLNVLINWVNHRTIFTEGRIAMGVQNQCRLFFLHRTTGAIASRPFG